MRGSLSSSLLEQRRPPKALRRPHIDGGKGVPGVRRKLEVREEEEITDKLTYAD